MNAPHSSVAAIGHLACRHALTSLVVLAIVVSPTQGRAGDLNAEVNAMFANLGTMGNYTAPGAFKGQVFGTYTGGNVYLRSPNKVYQLTATQFPNAKGGCGGIDLFGGSFSHISGQEFKNMLANITAALPGVAFQVALEVVSPLLGGITKWIQPYMDMINNARINSCETAKSLVSSAAEQMSFNSEDACAKLAVEMGLEPDNDAARRRCKTERASILASARASADPNIRSLAPLVGNLTWIALKSVITLDDREREFIMSMVGARVYPAESTNTDVGVYPPVLTSIKHLLYGQGDAGAGNIHVHVYRCDEWTRCNGVTNDPHYVHTPFVQKVETLMRSLATSIQTRTPIPNNSPEVGLVNSASEPLWRMLSVGNTIPGAGLSDQMIDQYKGVIAADYAFTFLERNLRIGLGALEKTYSLTKRQQEDVREMRERARTLLSDLGREKIALYTKVQGFTAIASHLEMLERQLRTSMPQHVMDMLGHQASFMTK